MSNLKKKIKNKLQEGIPSEKQVQTKLDDLSDVVTKELGVSDEEAKDVVTGLVSPSSDEDMNEELSEVNQEVMDKFIDQYGKEKGKQVYYATANKQDRDPESFHTEGDDAVSRGIEVGMNPEVQGDKWDEYRQLMQQMAADDDNGEQSVEEEMGSEGTNDPVKLKADVEKLMSKLDIGAIAPYLNKIDNPVEKAEVIAQFAEKIGVPKQRLGAVIGQLKTVAENNMPKMTKNKLIETVTGKAPRNVLKTVKVKDIK